MRKQIQAEHGKAEQDHKIKELEDRRTKQDNKIVELKAKIDAIDKRNAERKEVEVRKRDDELKYLKMQEGHLAKFVKQITEKSS